METDSETSKSSQQSCQTAEVKERVSTIEAMINLVTVIIGAGILALPQLPRRCGWVLSALMLLISCSAVQEAALCLCRALIQTNSQESKVTTFEALGHRALGWQGQLAVAVVANTFLLGVCSAYAALIGMQLYNLTGVFNQRAWVLIAYPIFVLLGLLPNLSALSKLVPLGMLAACLTGLMVIWSSLQDVETWQSWKTGDLDMEIHDTWPSQPAALGSALATCCAAFSFVPVVPAIIRDMRTPQHFPRALNGALAICGLLYLGVMLCGYYGYGNFIRDDIVESLGQSPATFEEAMHQPISEWTGARRPWLRVFISILILINIFLSMPLLAMAVFYSIESSFAHAVPGSWANWAMRIGLLTGVVAVALAVPRFTVVFSFFSSLTAPCVSLIFPLLFADYILEKVSKCRRGYHAVLFIIAVLSMIFGVYTSIWDVVSG
ncbi:Amino acid transporter AVT1C (AtAvt1C) [Durusdinium trenchii]|uniref:Amino acid transporter AVT1C (AtAvt1C) n=1 Tax=Durusdinium trenchii TaxID=1381693 RepID=A0ABP0I8G8_9DINO